MPKRSNQNNSKVGSLYSEAFDDKGAQDYSGAIQKFKQILKNLPKKPTVKDEKEKKHQAHYQLGICSLEYAKKLATNSRIIVLLYAMKHLAKAKKTANDTSIKNETFHIQKLILQVFQQFEKITTDDLNTFILARENTEKKFFKRMTILIKEMKELPEKLHKDLSIEKSKHFINNIRTFATKMEQPKLESACERFLATIENRASSSESIHDSDDDLTDKYDFDGESYSIISSVSSARKTEEKNVVSSMASDDETVGIPEEPLLKKRKLITEDSNSNVASAKKDASLTFFNSNNNNNNNNNNGLSRPIITTTPSNAKLDWEACKTYEELKKSLARGFAACDDKDVPALVMDFAKYRLSFFATILNANASVTTASAPAVTNAPSLPSPKN